MGYIHFRVKTKPLSSMKRYPEVYLSFGIFFQLTLGHILSTLSYPNCVSRLNFFLDFLTSKIFNQQNKHLPFVSPLFYHRHGQ